MGDARGFVFAEFKVGEPVEFLRVGTFVDMWGKEVEIDTVLMDAVIANFENGKAGQDVPIDVDHGYREAAGWVQEIWRDGEVLMARIDWSSLGEELVGGQVYRYLSASIDLKTQVLKAISLVNFPVVKGLKPVALSEGVYALGAHDGLLERIVTAIKGVFGEEVEDGSEELGEGRRPADDSDDPTDVGQSAPDQASDAPGGDGDGDDDSFKEVGAVNEEELREQIRDEVMAEMQEEEQTRAELREQIEADVRAELQAELAERQELAEFAQAITGGEAGLAVEPEQIVDLMAPMDEDAREAFRGVLEAKVVEFGERGSAREGAGGETRALPDVIKPMLKRWLDGGNDLAAFFEVNRAELGEMEQYDLAEFVDA
jgi:hypothetical protein